MIFSIDELKYKLRLMPQELGLVRSKEGSDHHDNRTPSGCLASYSSLYAYPSNADRERIYFHAIADSTSAGENSACTLVAAAVLAGIPYRDVREGFREVLPIRFDQQTFDHMTVREHGLLACSLAGYIGRLFKLSSLPEHLFHGTLFQETTEFSNVPKDCGALVTCASYSGKHMVACVEGKVYGLRDYAEFGSDRPIDYNDTNIMDMKLVPKVPVNYWVEFRRK